ncbi:MAG: AIR synthase related protein [Caldisphaeraceae archaeon]|nr:AIR synthase related protein [Caldisphaeraceae archaeon]
MRKWNETLTKLMRLAGNEVCIAYDACPLNGLLLNIDGYSMRRSILPWMSYSEWAYKATIASMSDVIVSGGKPMAILYSVGCNEESSLIEVAKGVGEASSYLGSRVLKGDANKAEVEPWIDVASVGSVYKKIVCRKGAKEGDMLLQVGYLGYGTLSEKIMRGEVRDIEEKALEKTKRPHLEVMAYRPISLFATSSSDNSDGWISTLYNIIDSSNVKVELERVVVDPDLMEYVKEEEAIKSWEDYSFAVTVPPEGFEEFMKECKALGIACFSVGRVSKGYGLYYKGVPVKDEGWSW